MSLRARVSDRLEARRRVEQLVDAHVARRTMAGRATPRWMRLAAVRLRMRAWRKGDLTVEQMGEQLEGVFEKVAAMGREAAAKLEEGE